MKEILKKSFALFGALAIMFSFSGALVASAATNTPNQTDSRITKIKEKAGEEIDRRTKALNAMMLRIGEMKKVSADDQASLVTTLQKTINDLSTLKAKIDADTDLTTLLADRQQITKSYRVFALVLPQTAITAAADRLETTADLLTDIADKLETAISEAETAGKDVTALSTALDDMRAKITDAEKQADDAKDAISGLVPDGGDKAKMESNIAALKSARDMIKAGHADLVAARADAGTIKDGLKAFNL